MNKRLVTRYFITYSGILVYDKTRVSKERFDLFWQKIMS